MTFVFIGLAFSWNIFGSALEFFYKPKDFEQILFRSKQVNYPNNENALKMKVLKEIKAEGSRWWVRRCHLYWHSSALAGWWEPALQLPESTGIHASVHAGIRRTVKSFVKFLKVANSTIDPENKRWQKYIVIQFIHIRGFWKKQPVHCYERIFACI